MDYGLRIDSNAGLRLQQNDTTVLIPTTLDVILRWDQIQKKDVDLDASCVLFDDIGNVLDGVYYNQLQIPDGSIQHSGDVVSGREGSTEVIRIDLPRLSPQIQAMGISITCYSASKGDSFKDVETAEVGLWDAVNKQQLAYFGLGCHGKHTAMIMCVIYRYQDKWILKAVGQPTEGRHFMDLVPKILKVLEEANVIDPILASERAKNKQFNMKKGDEFEIPDDLTSVAMGLGWDVDAGVKWDLDAAALLFRYTTFLENVYYFRLKSNDGAVIHKGDNLTGEGDGDDEQIVVNLQKLSKKINTIIFVVTVFTPEGNFSKIKNAFCRLIDMNTGKELCRYTLSEYSTKTAQIMCKLSRDSPSKWRFLAIGEGGSGQISKHMIPQAKPWLDPEPAKETVNVTVHEARNLKSTGDSLNPYFEVRFDTEKEKSKVLPS
eukprot:TRINITY_DN3101_c0_g1_i1.p1 TRINITY_DN3101_c0_g1~~TRINITY_DN3101_c0_g1_i1.p1  ORF type:complete len:433 (+),score=105.51 TRINITY_DN3101_c0_g1_i1:73-1371(+)